MLRLKFDESEKEKAEKLLQQCFWDVDKAIKKYKEDQEWEQKYSHILCCFEDKKYKSSFFSQPKFNTV